MARTRAQGRRLGNSVSIRLCGNLSKPVIDFPEAQAQDSARDQAGDDDQEVRFLTFDPEKCDLQSQSPLFTMLPPEIRDRIFALALQEYENTSERYDAATCYSRPGYLAPTRTHTALLRTCQLIYREAWFRSFTSAEATFYLTEPERAPKHFTTIKRLQPFLDLIHRMHGEVEIDSVRVFAQLYQLENGVALSRILDTPRLLPRSVTITIRHTDCWFWESDEPLRINGNFAVKCRFPDSVREVRMELESLVRKKAQVDDMVAQMMSNWAFQRKDGTFLRADSSSPGTVSVMRWSGNSTWMGTRWLRDETRPETLDYYCASVVFRADRANTGQVPHDWAKHSASISVRRPGPRLRMLWEAVTSSTLKAAGVPPGTSAQETVKMLEEHREQERQNRLSAARARRAHPLVSGEGASAQTPTRAPQD